MSMGRASMDNGLSYRCTFHTILQSLIFFMLSNDARVDVEVCHHHILSSGFWKCGVLGCPADQ
jgi:hypothetical protein